MSRQGATRKGLPALGALVGLCAAGCGAGISERPATTATASQAGAPADSGHLEIARLEGRIAFRRDEIGLPAAELPAPGEKPVAHEEKPPEALQGAPAEAPPPPPPMPTMAPRESRSWSRPSEEPEAAPRPRATRCHDVAAAADEICDAAERICRLADQLGDEPARSSCGRAREDCRHAKDLSGGCK